MDIIQEDQPVFSNEELKILKSVARSRIWLRMRDALCWRREQLFNETPTESSQLFKTWGKIEEIVWLLHSMPTLMVQYERYRKANAESSDARSMAVNMEPSLDEPEE